MALEELIVTEVDLVLADHGHDILGAAYRLDRKAAGEISVARKIKGDEFGDNGRTSSSFWSRGWMQFCVGFFIVGSSCNLVLHIPWRYLFMCLLAVARVGRTYGAAVISSLAN